MVWIEAHPISLLLFGLGWILIAIFWPGIRPHIHVPKSMHDRMREVEERLGKCITNRKKVRSRPAKSRR
jgi:hypothetical protein